MNMSLLQRKHRPKLRNMEIFVQDLQFLKIVKRRPSFFFRNFTQNMH